MKASFTIISGIEIARNPKVKVFGDAKSAKLNVHYRKDLESKPQIQKNSGWVSILELIDPGRLRASYRIH